MKLPQLILRRYQGEIDRFVTDHGRHDGKTWVKLHDICKQNAFKEGQYIGYKHKVWRVDKVEKWTVLTDPPIPGGDGLILTDMTQAIYLLNLGYALTSGRVYGRYYAWVSPSGISGTGYATDDLEVIPQVILEQL